jgi:hypothetical protein
MDAGAILPVAVLRDARKSALLRTRLIDDIDMIRSSETIREVCGTRVSNHPRGAASRRLLQARMRAAPQ